MKKINIILLFLAFFVFPSMSLCNMKDSVADDFSSKLDDIGEDSSKTTGSEDVTVDLSFGDIPLVLTAPSAPAMLEANQTNWDGGPGVSGPVTNFGNRFYSSTGINYSNNGYLTLMETDMFEQSLLYAMTVNLAFTEIGNLGGSNHFDYFVGYLYF